MKFTTGQQPDTPQPMRALVSIHDVMPHNLDKIDYCLDQLKCYGISNCYLLVVPGLAWNNVTLQRLRQYVAVGNTLVAHGWIHKAGKIASPYHHLHSLLISRDVAEHLSISPSEQITLMRKSRIWFADNLLPEPDFYVPPAWALGRLDITDLNKIGFRYVETLSGIWDLGTSTFHYLPLVGFEADTLLRSVGVSLSNHANLATKRILQNRTLRVAIHPDDFKLRLSPSLRQLLPLVDPESLRSAISHP